MKAIAWVVYLYNHAIAHERRHLATVNAFGDRNGAQLCPSNPEVQAYVDALTASVLAHDGLTGFVCESLSFLPFDYGLLNLKAAVRPGHRTRFLLGLCFCPHCHGRYARDGLNVDRFIVDVRAYVDQELARLPDHRDDAPVCEEWIDQAFDGRLRLAHLTRTEVATQLQARVLQTAKQAGLRVGSTSNEETCPFVSGVDEARLQAMRDEFRFELRPSMSTSMLRQSISRARERAGKDDLDRAKPIYGLTQLAHFETERSFVSTYERAFAEGLQHVRLYQFGLLTTRQLRWVAAMPSPSSDTRTLNLGTP